MDDKKWLLLRFSALGDITLTTGVLQYWHETKGLRFDVLTREGFEDIFKGHPAVDKVICLSNDDLSFPNNIKKFRELARVYSGCGLLDLHDTLRSRILAALWSGEVRRYNKLSLERRAFLLSGHRLFENELLASNVPQRYSSAFESVPPPPEKLLPVIYLSEEEKAEAEELLQKNKISTTASLVAIHPYATHSQKAWPMAKWQELFIKLHELELSYFIVGQDKSTPFAFLKERDLTNKSSLRETCALLGRADVLISGDSGPMHLACAVKTPVLALFGPTTRHWGFFPAGKDDRVLEANTPGRPYSLHGKSSKNGRNSQDADCMSTISVDSVLKELKATL